MEARNARAALIDCPIGESGSPTLGDAAREISEVGQNFAEIARHSHKIGHKTSFLARD